MRPGNQFLSASAPVCGRRSHELTGTSGRTTGHRHQDYVAEAGVQFIPQKQPRQRRVQDMPPEQLAQMLEARVQWLANQRVEEQAEALRVTVKIAQQELNRNSG